jgi:hypothetical protein
VKHGSNSVLQGVMLGRPLGKKREVASKPENYTIFHALVEALHDKDKAEGKERGRSSVRRFGLHK